MSYWLPHTTQLYFALAYSLNCSTLEVQHGLQLVMRQAWIINKFPVLSILWDVKMNVIIPLSGLIWLKNEQGWGHVSFLSYFSTDSLYTAPITFFRPMQVISSLNLQSLSFLYFLFFLCSLSLICRGDCLKAPPWLIWQHPTSETQGRGGKLEGGLVLMF